MSFSDYLCFDNLDSFEEHWLGIFQNAHQMDFSDVFLMFRQDLWVLGRKITERNHFLSHNIKSTCYQQWLITIDVELNHIAKIMFVSFPTMKWLCSHLCLYLWERWHCVQLTFKGRRVIFCLLQDNMFMNYLEIFYTRVSPIIYLYNYGLGNIYFILWAKMQTCFISFIQILWALVIGNCFIWFLYAIDIYSCKIIIHASCPSPRISLFPQEP